jgi:hypothetical protein
MRAVPGSAAARARIWEREGLGFRPHLPPYGGIAPAAFHQAYRYPKGVSGNPSGMSRFYFECRRIFQENAPELARAIVELALDQDADQRVRSVCLVAALDRAGIKPMDYDPAQEQVQPTWDPGALTAEEREDLKALLKKMIG